MADGRRDRLPKISDVLVEGSVVCRAGAFVVRLGRAQPDGGDHYTPLEVQGFFEGTVAVYGVGPVDSLMNAMALVRRYLDPLNGLSNEPLPRI